MEKRIDSMESSSNLAKAKREDLIAAYDEASYNIKADFIDFETGLKTTKAKFESVLYNAHYFGFLTQINKFRKVSFLILIYLMVIETFTLFIILILSSLTNNSFLKVDNLTLNILVGATLTQVSVMMVLIIKSVFPVKLNDIMLKPTILERNSRSAKQNKT